MASGGKIGSDEPGVSSGSRMINPTGGLLPSQ